MNKQSTQPQTKKIGVVKTLFALAAMGGQNSTDQLMLANSLLTNNYRAPIPGKFINQRQKRKLARQMA